MIRLPLSVLAAMWLWIIGHDIYEATHEPVDLGDQDPDYLFFHGLVLAQRAENALLASDPNVERVGTELMRRTWAGLIRVDQAVA